MMNSSELLNAHCNSDFELAACDYCGQKQYESIITTTAFDLTEPFVVVRCTHCGLLFTNPRPTPATIGRYYAGSYYSYRPFNSIRDLKFRDRIKYKLYDAYYNPNKHRFFSLVAKNLLGGSLLVPPREKMGSLLDVGCGAGGFLLMMRQCGWKTAGIELGEEACAIANRHGLNVHWGTLEDTPFLENSFDVIVLSQSLEHFYSPKSALNVLHHLLKPDGILIIGVPNYDSFDRRLFNENWHAWELPRHLYHFTPDSLSRYLQGVGFNILSTRSKMLTMPPQVTFREIRKKIEKYSNSRWYKFVCAMGLLFQVWIIKPILMLTSKHARENLGVHMAFYASK